MPPVLHVAFLELVCGSQDDLFARDVRTAVDKRHHVLQLIAKTESASGLIKGCSRPNAARKRLVEEPAVEHCVQRLVRRSDFDSSEEMVPVRQHLFKCCVD